MNNNITNFINEQLPEKCVYSDIKKILAESPSKIILDDSTVLVNEDDKLEIIYRSIVDDKNLLFLGSLRACVALGDYKIDESGFIDINKCLIYLYYDDQNNLISWDFSKNL